MGEYRTTIGDPPPLPKRERRARLRLGLLLGALVLAAVAAGGYHLRFNRDVPAGGNVISGKYAQVRTPVAGQVESILVGSGQTVRHGDQLVQLENARERAEVAEARRAAEKAEAELALRQAELSEQRRLHAHQLETARQTLAHQRDRLELTRKLADQGLASGRELADHQHAIQLAEIAYRELAEADRQVDDRRLDVAAREVALRREAVAQAEVQLAAREVRAPLDGKVLRYPFYVGEVVRPENVLYEVFGGDGWLLRLRVPERFATRVEIGQPCRAKLRSYPSLRGRWFHGEVVEVRDAIQSDAQQSYRVVYVAFDPGATPVPPGATAEARIRVGRSALWEILLGL